MSDRPLCRFELPWPPSVNRYWRTVVYETARGPVRRTLVSREGRIYRRGCAWRLASVGLARMRLDGALELVIDAWPPDRRRRDADNIAKAILDAVEHAGLIRDDVQVRRLVIEMHDPCRPGHVEVRIRPLAGRSKLPRTAASIGSP